MAEKTHGNVTISYTDSIQVPPESGTLSAAEVAHIEKTRKGVGITAVLTAAAIRKTPDLAPKGIIADELENLGHQADDIDLVVSDLEVLLNYFKQANLIIDAKTQESLRKVLAHVRAQEKFNAGIIDSVPQLVEYFKNRPSSKPAAQ